MNTAMLPPRIASKLARICGMFGSAHDGERANAAAAADKLVRDHGLTWTVLFGVERSADTSNLSVADMIRVVQAHMDILTPRESRFVANISTYPLRGWSLSTKQHSWLAGLYARVARESHP
jgi:hypothetical protein